MRMSMRENVQQLSVCIVLVIIIFLPDALFAEATTRSDWSSDVCSSDLTYTEAKKLALQDAKRILLEKVGTYIESKTEVKNGIVKSDEIKQYTAGIVKVEEVGDEKTILANKATVVKVNVKAIVDSDAVIKQLLSFRNRDDIERSAKRLSSDNDKLRREIDQLNQQLRNVIDDEKKYQQLNTQRKEIIKQIDTNETGLTLLLSGEGLHTAALLTRQNKEDSKTKVKKFIKGIASTCKLSSSALEVDDNGDGTANVTFTVKAYMPFDLGNPLTRRIAAEYYDINLNDILSTGLNFGKVGGAWLGLITIGCENEKCMEILKFMYSEIRSVVLSVKLGTREIKNFPFMSDSMVYEFYSSFKKTYQIRMPLSELKSLSQLKLKIIYDSDEYGQKGALSKQ